MSVLVISSGDVKHRHTPLRYVCLVSGVQDILLTSTGLICRDDFDTSIWCCSWVDRSLMHPLASDPAGDPSRDPLPLPELEPEPDEPYELKWLPLDLWSDAEPLPEEEEPDCERHGEGDLAHLCLVGEHTAGEEVEGKPSWGSSSASRPVGRGAVEVEVEADGPVLTVAAALPPVLWRIASFKMYSAFLQLSGGSMWAISRLWSPSQGLLSISFGREPCDDGWGALVHEVCWKGGECVQEAEHNIEAST